MRKIALPLLALLAGSYCAYAQPSAKVEFEVASIKPSSPPTGGVGYAVGCRGGPGTNDPGLYTCGDINLLALVMDAYGENFWQVSGPDWMLMTRFDLRAVVPEGTTKEQFRIMLQNLLADRFKVAVHHETREIQRYELRVAKNGPKFKESSPATKDDANPLAPGPIKRDENGYPVVGHRGMAMTGGKARMNWPEMTMEMLANTLSGQLHGPVTDATGLTGKYDISIYWSYEDALARPPDADPARSTSDPGPTIAQALQDQLGLRVESKKGPVDFLVVDHAERVPTEN
jgi:uncharacterized protein (TIGR03435 family)